MHAFDEKKKILIPVSEQKWKWSIMVTFFPKKSFFVPRTNSIIIMAR